MIDPATLYIVATPIGNLEDISLRALQILKQVDVIAAEDTRHSGRLLSHYEISTKMMAYHDHSDQKQLDKLLARLAANESIALISDAGTPLISDPGYALVKQARENGYNVVPVPGACAVIAALCASGLSSYQFSFEGFTPAKSFARKNAFRHRRFDERTLIFYESPHRISDCLDDALEIFGENRKIVLARELTKTFETFLSGTIKDVRNKVLSDSNQKKGEMVLLVSGYVKPELEGILSASAINTMTILMQELPLKQAASLCAKLTDEKRNKLYQWGLDNKSSI